MRIEKILEEIGLTGSEIKVYLALLKIGQSSKGNIVKEAGIASSKIYEVLDKLVEKGLVSSVKKDNVMHFSAFAVTRIMDYLEEKKKRIAEQEKELGEVIKCMNKLQKKEGVDVGMFIGWQGMRGVYSDYLNKSKKGDKVFIIGAGVSDNEEQLETFYSKYGKLAFERGLDIKVIFNNSAREYIKRIEENIGFSYNKKFLFDNTPSEIMVLGEISMIIIRRDEPIVVVIKDNETANSFREYFMELWKIAKN